jgi:hypothetical protein
MPLLRQGYARAAIKKEQALAMQKMSQSFQSDQCYLAQRDEDIDR